PDRRILPAAVDRRLRRPAEVGTQSQRLANVLLVLQLPEVSAVVAVPADDPGPDDPAAGALRARRHPRPDLPVPDYAGPRSALLFRGAVVRDQDPGHRRGGGPWVLAGLPLCAGRAGAAGGQVRLADGLCLVRRRLDRLVLPLPVVRRGQGEAQGCLVVELPL